MPIASIRLRCILWAFAQGFLRRPMFPVAAKFALLLTSKALALLLRVLPGVGFLFPNQLRGKRVWVFTYFSRVPVSSVLTILAPLHKAVLSAFVRLHFQTS